MIITRTAMEEEEADMETAPETPAETPSTTATEAANEADPLLSKERYDAEPRTYSAIGLRDLEAAADERGVRTRRRSYEPAHWSLKCIAWLIAIYLIGTLIYAAMGWLVIVHKPLSNKRHCELAWALWEPGVMSEGACKAWGREGTGSG
jgi:hypothetical protein